MDRLTGLLNASAFVRRLTALFVVFVLLMAALTGSLMVASLLRGQATEITEKREELGRLHSVIALRKALENEPVAANSGNPGSEFLSGSSEAVIRGNLQSRFTALASSHGVNVISVGNAPPLQKGDIRYAGLRADFSGTNEAVLSTLFEIETSAPYLVIRNATIRSNNGFQPGNEKTETIIVAQVLFYGALPPAADVADARAGGRVQ